MVEDISCDDVKTKQIDYENMTIDEINLILKENFEKNLNKSDSSCKNIKSKKASGKSSSTSSGVTVNVSEAFSGSENSSYQSKNKEIKTTSNESASQSSSSSSKKGEKTKKNTSSSAPDCIKSIKDNNDLERALKEAISIETDFLTKEKLTQEYLSIKGLDKEDTSCN
tara:strand:+ start:495 stop:998 length:504 start_codon:yes stop_codon:yes gene_type:complete